MSHPSSHIFVSNENKKTFLTSSLLFLREYVKESLKFLCVIYDLYVGQLIFDILIGIFSFFFKREPSTNLWV